MLLAAKFQYIQVGKRAVSLLSTSVRPGLWQKVVVDARSRPSQATPRPHSQILLGTLLGSGRDPCNHFTLSGAQHGSLWLSSLPVRGNASALQSGDSRTGGGQESRRKASAACRLARSPPEPGALSFALSRENYTLLSPSRSLDRTKTPGEARTVAPLFFAWPSLPFSRLSICHHSSVHQSRSMHADLLALASYGQKRRRRKRASF